MYLKASCRPLWSDYEQQFLATNNKDLAKSMASEALGFAGPLTIAVFGDKKVGKTSLIRRFIGQSFSVQHNPTVEDFYEEEIIRGTHRCRQLQILDTTGSYDFPVMRQLAISKSEAFILVYSLDDPKSFEKVKWHRQEILKYKQRTKVPILVVCNKTDLTDIASLEAIVSHSTNSKTLPFFEELQAQKKVVDEWDCKLMFTSAKVRWNINKVFYELVNIEEEKNNLSVDKNTNQRRRSSLWLQIVCPSHRQARPKHLVRTRSLSA